MLENAGAGSRRSAAEALGKLGMAARDAAPDLQKALDNEDREVRLASLRALRQMSPWWNQASWLRRSICIALACIPFLGMGVFFRLRKREKRWHLAALLLLATVVWLLMLQVPVEVRSIALPFWCAVLHLLPAVVGAIMLQVELASGSALVLGRHGGVWQVWPERFVLVEGWPALPALRRVLVG